MPPPNRSTASRTPTSTQGAHSQTSPVANPVIQNSPLRFSRDILLGLVGTFAAAGFTAGADHLLNLGFTLQIQVLFGFCLALVWYAAFRLFQSHPAKVPRAAIILGALLAPALGVLFLLWFTTPHFSRPSLVLMHPASMSNSVLKDRLADVLQRLPRTLSNSTSDLDVVVHEHTIDDGEEVLDNRQVNRLLNDANVLGVILLYQHGQDFTITALDPVQELLRRAGISIAVTEGAGRSGYETWKSVRIDTEYEGVAFSQELDFVLDARRIPTIAPAYNFWVSFPKRSDAELLFQTQEVTEAALPAAIQYIIKKVAARSYRNEGDYRAACDALLSAPHEELVRHLSDADFASCDFTNPEAMYDLYNSSAFDPVAPSKRDLNRLIALVLHQPELRPFLWQRNPISTSVGIDGQAKTELLAAQQLRERCGAITRESSYHASPASTQASADYACVSTYLAEQSGASLLSDAWEGLVTEAARQAAKQGRRKDFDAVTKGRSLNCARLIAGEIEEWLLKPNVPGRDAWDGLLRPGPSTGSIPPDQCYQRLNAFANAELEAASSDFFESFQSITRFYAELQHHDNNLDPALIELTRQFNEWTAALRQGDNASAGNIMGAMANSYSRYIEKSKEKFRLERVRTERVDAMKAYSQRILATMRSAFDAEQVPNDSAHSGATPIMGPPSYLQESEVERLVFASGMQLLARLRSNGSIADERLESDADALVARYPRSTLARWVAGLVYVSREKWDKLYETTGDSDDEYSLVFRKTAASYLQHWDEAIQLTNKLASQSDTEWERTVYLGQARLLRMIQDHDLGCVNLGSIEETDRLTNILSLLNPSLSLRTDQWRELVGGLWALISNRNNSAYRGYASEQAAELWFIAKNGPLAFALERFAKERPDLVVAVFELQAVHDRLFANRFQDNPWNADQVLDVVLAEANLSRGSFDSTGCFMEPETQ